MKRSGSGRQRQTDGDSHDARPLRVLLTNSLTLNGGDAAIIEATALSLRKAVGREIHFIVFDRQPEVAARLFPRLDFRPWPWDVFFPHSTTSRFTSIGRRLIRSRAYVAAFLLGRGAVRLSKLILKPTEWLLLQEYAQADLVVSKGGTYLVEIYDLEPHLFDFQLCMLLRRPLVLAPQSLGPFTKPRTKRLLRKVFRRALVFLRDEKSLEHARALGVNSRNLRVSADSVFALADPARLATARIRRLRRPLRVAVSVRQWRYFRDTDTTAGMERYVDALNALVRHLVDRYDAQVTFLSTCQGVPEYFFDDSELAREIVEGLPQDVTPAVAIDGSYHTTRELLEELVDFDVVVATRMHFAILALAAGIPVLPIAYEFKTVELFRRLGMSTEVLDIETIDPQNAIRAFDTFIARLPAERASLFEGVESQYHLAQHSADVIAALLRDSPCKRSWEAAGAGRSDPIGASPRERP